METVVTDAVERRQADRCHRVEDHGIVSARVKPARDAIVVNVSAGGALVETIHRLLPGTVVDLQLDRAARRIVVRGRVIRCSVAAVQPSAVTYRAAIVFDRPVAWLDPGCWEGNQLPAGAATLDDHRRAPITRHDGIE